MVSSVFVLPLAPASNAQPSVRRSTRTTKRATTKVRLLTEFVADAENSLIRVVVDSFLATPRYNPLVVVGPSAVGKSALTSGLVERWNSQNADQRAVLMAGDDFVRAYADALETDSLERFRRRFAQAGAVVVDGLESLVEKQSAQLEFARLIDALCDQLTPLLVTCRSEPDLPQFHPALWSRLQGGLVAPLLPPGADARRKILADLLRLRRVQVEPGALDFLAREAVRDPSTRPTVPQLVELVDHLTTTVGSLPRPWSVADLRTSLEQRPSGTGPDVAQIARVVAEYFGVRLSDLKGSSRRRQVVRARGLATYLARQTTGQSLERLGQFFGGRDHTTTLHACRTMEKLLQTDPLMQQAASAISQRLASQS